jgi:hypothetical protein
MRRPPLLVPFFAPAIIDADGTMVERVRSVKQASTTLTKSSAAITRWCSRWRVRQSAAAAEGAERLQLREHVFLLTAIVGPRRPSPLVRSVCCASLHVRLPVPPSLALPDSPSLPSPEIFFSPPIDNQPQIVYVNTLKHMYT